VGFIPDICSDNKSLWQWAGINFGEYTCMMLQKSLSKLAASSAATNVRLWGKVNGTKSDYFIAEGSAEGGAGEDEERPADIEARGAPGVN
jgi:radial spoke head protein 4/6